MKKITGKALKTLKVIHITGVALWISGVMATLVALVWVSHLTAQEAVLSSFSLMELLDYALIIPGAALCYLTGTVYSFFTPWGFTKHRWIVLKWVLYNLACIPAMILALPSTEAMRQFVLSNGSTSIASPEFFDRLLMHGCLTGYILIIFIFLVVISVFKPSRKKR